MSDHDQPCPAEAGTPPSEEQEPFRDWLARQIETCAQRAVNDNTKKSREYHGHTRILLLGVLAEYDRREGAQARALREAQEEIARLKTLANIGTWHNECRPNREMAARELQKSQTVIDKLADQISTLNASQDRLREALAEILASDTRCDADVKQATRDAALAFIAAVKIARAALATPARPTECQLAERIARQAHASQRDTVTGAPYITHVERVVEMVEGDAAKAVAWLHDVLEDSDFTAAELHRAGISDAVIDAVEVLTRPDNDTSMVIVSYEQYIDRIVKAGNPLALAVKVADLRDHLRPNCPERLRPRYERALARLTEPGAQEGRPTP